MATLYTQQASNIRKTWLLVTVFFVVVIGLGWIISQVYGNPFILYVAVIFSVVINMASYWYSDKLVLTLTRARPATREEFFDLCATVENLAITTGLPPPKVYIVDDPAPNAFATGRDPAHAVVCATSGLVAMMTKTELEGVMAHELSHIGNRDMLLSTMVVVLVGFIAILSDIFLRSLWFGGGRRRGNDKAGGVLVILGIMLAILSPIIAALIQLAISRKREFLADASGALLTRYPEGLASALAKIGQYEQPMRRASNSTAHLFIANPFGSGARGLHKLFLTHPPLEERVRILREM